MILVKTINNRFKFALASYLSVFGILLPLSVKAYPKTENKACIKSATSSLKNNGVKASNKAIGNYCDCALKKIIDENQESDTSIESCNNKYIF